MLHLVLGKMIGYLIQEQLATSPLEDIFWIIYSQCWWSNILCRQVKTQAIKAWHNHAQTSWPSKLYSAWCFISPEAQAKLVVFGPHMRARTLHSCFWWKGWGHKSITSLTCHERDRIRTTFEDTRYLCLFTKLLIQFSLWWRHISIKAFMTC